MSANVETMFSVRETPWHGLGTIISEAPSSYDGIRLAKINWRVIQKPMYLPSIDGTGFEQINGRYANVRETDNAFLGDVSDRYAIVQNEDAFAFTDALLGEGVRYETAGSLAGGRKVWLLAKLPDEIKINGDVIEPYLVFTNTHDGSGAVRVAMTPVRVVCQNTLNLALSTAKRQWSTVHKGDIASKLHDAEVTLGLARNYMMELELKSIELQKKTFGLEMAEKIISDLFPVHEEATDRVKRGVKEQREDLLTRYLLAPDLDGMDGGAWRMMNAVSDYATHHEPLRRTKNYQENLFSKTVDGQDIVDRALVMMDAIV